MSDETLLDDDIRSHIVDGDVDVVTPDPFLLTDSPLHLLRTLCRSSQD